MPEARRLPDVSAFFAAHPKRFDDEDCIWREQGLYVDYAAHVNRVCERYHLKTVLEVACGCGYVAQNLTKDLTWVGMDGYAGCVAAAQRNNPGATVYEDDIRRFRHPPLDLVCSFAFLKHFSLAEFPEIMARFLSLGRMSVSTVQIGHADEDDGTEVHHNWLSWGTLERAVKAGGHEIVERNPRWMERRDGWLREEAYIVTRGSK